MALEEHDREDLMREATAMPVRGELEIDGATVFLGLRPNHLLSIYWTSEPVWQFDRQGRLRRAFWQSRKVAAVNGQLYWVESLAKGGPVKLQRTALSDLERSTLGQAVTQCVAQLQHAFGDPCLALSTALPSPADFRQAITAALTRISLPVAIATHAEAGAK